MVAELYLGRLRNKLEDNSGSIVSDYGLNHRAIGVRSPAGAEDFFLYPLCPDRLWGPLFFLLY
jgi:hypothetical protein